MTGEFMLEKRLDGKRREAWHERAGAQCTKTKVIGQWGDLSGRDGRMRTYWNPDLRMRRSRCEMSHPTDVTSP